MKHRTYTVTIKLPEEVRFPLVCRWLDLHRDTVRTWKDDGRFEVIDPDAPRKAISAETFIRLAKEVVPFLAYAEWEEES